MPPKLVGTLAVMAALLVSAPVALAAGRTRATALAKGDLVVTFSGAGSGSYHFHEPAAGAGSACKVADTTYSETDSYHWIYRFVVPPTGGISDTPVALTAEGQVSSSEQLLQCAANAAVASTCTQALRAPALSNATDLTYPGVTVGVAGRYVTVGALGELVPATSQPQCSGIGVLLPNPVEAFGQLQANVSIARADLAASGDVTKRFTIAGSGLYAGVALSGSCNSSSCDPATCASTSTPGGAGASTCGFDESYTGTIEVRVVK
ncbi:MAG: hypothetical protein ABSF58_11450 [Solirubrobacteraceae bacterium]|jgi:hypothetical protein